MDSIKKYKKTAISLGAAVIISLLFRRLFPLVIFTIGLLVIYFPLKSSLASSIVFRLTIVLVALLCVFQMEAMVFWVLHIWASPLLYVVTTLLLTGGLLLFLAKKNKLERPALAFGRIDLLLILPSLLIGGIYVAGTLTPAEKDDVTIVRSIMYGMDDATHANIFSDVLRHDSNILAGEERSKLMNKSSHSSYPMGWHVSSSVMAESFAGGKDRSPIESIEVYFYAKVLTLMLTILAITIFIFSLSQRLWPRLRSIITIAGITGISVFVSSLLVLPLFFDGFFSFMPIILYTVLFAVILLDGKRDSSEAIFLAFLAAASSLTWMLTGPVLMVAFAFYYYKNYGSLRSVPRSTYAAFALSGIFLLCQAYILYSANKNALQNISNEGGIVNPDHMLLAVCLAVFFALWLKKSKARDILVQPLFGLIVTFAGVLTVLLAYLTIQSSEITYYFFKLQVPLLVILLPLVCVYLFGLLLTSDRTKTFIDQAILLVTGFIVLGISIPSIIGYSYVYNLVERAHSYTISPNDGQILVDASLSRPVSNENRRILFLFPGDSARTILNSNIDKLGYRSTTCDYELFSAVYTADINTLDKDIRKCASELPTITIYTDKNGESELKKQLDPAFIEQHEVELVVI